MSSCRATNANREAAIVLAEPAWLPPFAEGKCPGCGLSERFRARFCRGSPRWLLGLRRCRETRQHLHFTHECGCGASWVTAPFDPAARLT